MTAGTNARRARRGSLLRFARSDSAYAGPQQRGMTLLEVLVSLAVLAMIGVLIYGAFDSLGRGKKGEAIKTERSREARTAIARMTRDLSSAFLSMHTPQNLSLVTRQTTFLGKSSSTFDRLDFTAFAHRRTEADSRESDQCELGYFAAKNPDKEGKMDLVRREQSPIDAEPTKGGVVNVLVEDIESFDVRYLDPMTGQWTESWDATQAATGQFGRLPLQVKITLVLATAPPGVDKTYMAKVGIPIQQPLAFGIVR